jgi:hypothetical protein
MDEEGLDMMDFPMPVLAKNLSKMEVFEEYNSDEEI